MADKSQIKDLFDRVAPHYGGFGNDYFDVFARRLCQCVPAFPGANVLDVATGRGAILKHALKGMQGEGIAHGIDISHEMIVCARKEVRDRNAILQCMDAESLSFDDHSFDIVYCAFGLFFFPDIHKAMREFSRVLKPGGKIAVSTWGEIGPSRSLLKQKLSDLGIDPCVSAFPPPMPAELQQLFEGNRFSSIEIIPDKLDHVYMHFDHWWECLSAHASRMALEKLTESQSARIKEELAHELSAWNRPDGFHEQFNVYYTTAVAGVEV